MAQTMDRRKFLSLAASSVAVGALIALQGCSSGSDSDSTPESPTTYTDKNGAISANHGHAVTLTAAQQQAAAEVRLYLEGGDHSHKIGLTAAEVASVAAGTRWSGECTNDFGHTHVVTFN